MQTITTIGLDIAKAVFQVHGVDEASLCSDVLPEAAAMSSRFRSLRFAHHWSRELQALGQTGHTVRLIPPAYVKPYVKRQQERWATNGHRETG
jgi:transposase